MRSQRVGTTRLYQYRMYLSNMCCRRTSPKSPSWTSNGWWSFSIKLDNWSYFI